MSIGLAPFMTDPIAPRRRGRPSRADQPVRRRLHALCALLLMQEEYSADEVAEGLGISVRTAYDWRDRALADEELGETVRRFAKERPRP